MGAGVVGLRVLEHDGRPESPNAEIGFGTVVVDEHAVVAAVAEEGAAETADGGGS